MTSGARLFGLVLVFCQLVVWTCPAYCGQMAAQKTPVGETAASAHDHHPSDGGREDGDPRSIEDAGSCCQDCGPVSMTQALVEKYGVAAKVSDGPVTIVQVSVEGLHLSAAPALTHYPPGASPPEVASSPLRI